LAEYFPKQVIGRANGALGVLDIGGAFILQYATGLMIQQWPGEGGHYPTVAYQTAFAINVVLQVFALGWFVLPYIRERVAASASDVLGRAAFRFDNHPRSGSLYDRAAQVWAARIVAARREAMNWRLAALASMSLTALLGLAIAISAGRASVVRYVTEVQSLPEVATPKVALEPERTLHTQIVFPWDQSSTNTPSLSIDLATIRERWLDAYSYDYVEDREVETFNGYNRGDGSPASFGSVRHRRGHPWHRHRSHQTR
jgi:hypothetical protein